MSNHGLVGGAAAAGIFRAAAGTIYLGLGFAFSVTLALVLPGLAAFVWPLLTAKARNEVVKTGQYPHFKKNILRTKNR
jgi:hypothetical protein